MQDYKAVSRPHESLESVCVIFVDFSVVCAKIIPICKDVAETKQELRHVSERGAVKALCQCPASHFQVARDDRDGRSRYRAAKIPGYPVN